MSQSKATKNGNNAVVRQPPALDPERMAVVQPWRDFLSRGLILEINAKFTPTGTTISLRVPDSLKLPEGVDRNQVPPGLVKSAIQDSGLVPKRGKSAGSGNAVEQPMPARSLCDRDVVDVSKLPARISSVSEKIGPTAAAGRIGSLKLYIEGLDTFEKWWAAAPSDSKVRLLTDEKHYKGLSADAKGVISSYLRECPFRGSVPTPSEEEEADEPEKSEKPKAPSQVKGKAKQAPRKSQG